MERYMYLWRGLQKIYYNFGDQPNGLICKLATVKDHVFVSTTTNNLYHGIVSQLDADTPPSLTFKRAQFYAVDIAANSEHLFVVNCEGQVLKIIPSDMTVVDTITLREEPKSCSHGYKTDNETVKVKALAVSDNATLFVADNGQLWASGDQPQIDIKTSEPKKVTFFDGRIVSGVACGANFNVALVRKIVKAMKDDTDSENDMEEEVFVSSCPHCVSDVMLSPVSQPSTDTCPLGLHVRQSSEDRSTNSTSALSTASKDHEDDEKRFDEPSKTLTNGDDGLTVEIEREEKKNVIFINTEAARQFLTRQLSWVSSYGNAGEELLAECTDRPTRILKQNVSNMASLVYEGVKTVGDKVVTLSRHMSGSSDNNEAQDNGQDGLEELGTGETKPTATSLANSLRCEEFPWSSSAGTSERELSEQGLNDRINSLVRNGNSLLSTELWTWGDIQYGQLGTGDIVKRPRPVLVPKLNNLGIKKIVSGGFHVLALTLDGRSFIWGRNNSSQITPQSPSNQSSPILFNGPSLSPTERARDMAAGEKHTLVMTSLGLYWMGKPSFDRPGELVKLDIPEAVGYSAKHILCSGSYSCCTTINQPICDISFDLTNEQIFLEEMLLVYQNLIKPFQKKGGATQESNVYETLCQCYTELISFTALNVLSLWDYYEHHGEAYEVVVVASIEEYITVYKHYLNAICDVVSLGGFTHIARIIDVPSVLNNLFTDRLKGSKGKKANNEAIIALALQHPLNRLNRYKSMVQSLIRINGPKLGIERLQEALGKWEQICDEQERRQKEAETTKQFWESSGKLVELLRSPDRRLIRESRTHPIAVLNSGRFSTHWFVLLTDILIHVNGTSHTVHPLPTLWVEPLQDTDTLQEHVAWRKLIKRGFVSNALSVTTPEDSLVLYTPTPGERTEWLQALQTAIKRSLLRVVGHVPPLVRSSSFSFTKHSVYKDAKYTGRWLNGKPHGPGKLEWNDGRMYAGHFHRGIMHGTGKMEIPTQGIYEGQWKDGQQNGYGTMKYITGDIYDGYFKDGLPQGHGIKKEGHFMASVASIYIGEWVAGLKQGYGVMDDITTGEKYLGSWSNNMKHGCGLIVTLDGIYYEGVFMQDVLTGHGVMIFEDGTHYEGEFRSAGVFSGKGTLTFSSGDRIEGSMNGAWNEGVKITATLHMNVANGSSQANVNAKPTSFGKLCVSPDQKWKAIFRQCYQQLGVSEPNSKSSNLTPNKVGETQRVWQNVAVVITNSHQDTIQRKKDLATDLSGNKDKEKEKEKDKDRHTVDHLEKIPQFGLDSLNLSTYEEVHNYLIKAFESSHHPLGTLLTEVAAAYTATYGGVRVHPLLLSHAVSELHSITSRVYHVVTLLFPALPPGGQELILETDDDDEEESKVVSAAAILHPVLLPRVHSALFVLYALHNKKEDDAYWKRLLKWNKQPDITLMAFLGIDPKFWKSANANHLGENPLTSDTEQLFGDAVETLQQLKTTFSPLEKLLVIRNTFEQMTQAVQRQLGSTYLWTMDELFPVFHFVVVRARVLQLGSEINFVEDFMEPYLQNGELGIMFTTLKACYYQILQEKMSMSN